MKTQHRKFWPKTILSLPYGSRVMEVKRKQNPIVLDFAFFFAYSIKRVTYFVKQISSTNLWTLQSGNTFNIQKMSCVLGIAFCTFYTELLLAVVVDYNSSFQFSKYFHLAIFIESLYLAISKIFEKVLSALFVIMIIF